MQKRGAFFARKKEGEMGNIQKKINKLLMALRQQGIVYKINTKQFYSENMHKADPMGRAPSEGWRGILQQGGAPEVSGGALEGSERGWRGQKRRGWSSLPGK